MIILISEYMEPSRKTRFEVNRSFLPSCFILREIEDTCVLHYGACMSRAGLTFGLDLGKVKTYTSFCSYALAQTRECYPPILMIKRKL